MMKQPKYFYSTSSAQACALEKKLSLELHQSIQWIQSSIRIPQVQIPSRILFSIGILAVFGIGGLGAFSYMRAHAIVILHPQPDTTTNVIVGSQGQGTGKGLTFDAKTADGRAQIVANFLERYKSPLKPYDHYGQVLVEMADRYNLDYRLLPAIMMQESNLCKTSDPSIHNCLGFGIHKRGTLAFDSYEESFDRAARELKERYIDIGLTTPEQIMTKYTPSSNGSWANSVNQWIAEMEHNSREKGIQSEQDADLTQYTAKL